VLALVAGLVGLAAVKRTTTFTKQVELPAMPSQEGAQVWFSDPFEVEGGKNLQLAMQAHHLSNAWAYVDGDLVNEETGLVAPFSLQAEYWHGVDYDGAWSEGDSRDKTVLSAVPGGTYVLRLETSWKEWTQPFSMTVTIDQGVGRPFHFLFLVGAICLVPILVLVYQRSFDKRRWSESDYSPFAEEDDE
jgi:hypothetical protein